MNLDQGVREALRHKADEARPAELAEAALQQAKRVQSRRWMAVGTGLLALVLTVAFGVTQVTDKPDAPAVEISPDIPDPESGKLPLGLGWYLVAGPGEGGAFVWDPQAGEFAFYPDSAVWQSPVGQKLAVHAVKAKSFYITYPAEPTWDLLQGRSLADRPQWNANGTRILFGVSTSETGTTEYRIADVQARTVTTLQLGCDPRCKLVWLPGQSVVGHHTATGMDLYSLSGQPMGSVGYQAVSSTSWSADDSLVVGSVNGEPALIDAGSGQKVCKLSGMDSPSRLVYWRENKDFMAMGEELGYYDTACKMVFSTTLPSRWIPTEQDQFTLVKE